MGIKEGEVGRGPLCSKEVEREEKEGEVGVGRKGSKGRGRRGWWPLCGKGWKGEGRKGRGRTGKGSAIAGTNPYC